MLTKAAVLLDSADVKATRDDTGFLMGQQLGPGDQELVEQGNTG